MSFSEHKITNFTHRISDLPDQPDLSPVDLKARFDSAPEQLRQSVNGICDDAQRLDDRVSGIVAETFGDAIPKTMLTEELQSEIEGKAEQTALTAETAALQTQITALNTEKCEIYLGSYTGDGASQREVVLGFRPKAVLSLQDGRRIDYSNSVYGGLAFDDHPVMRGDNPCLWISENGFTVVYNKSAYIDSNSANLKFYFLAFR